MRTLVITTVTGMEALDVLTNAGLLSRFLACYCMTHDHRHCYGTQWIWQVTCVQYYCSVAVNVLMSSSQV